MGPLIALIIVLAFCVIVPLTYYAVRRLELRAADTRRVRAANKALGDLVTRIEEVAVDNRDVDTVTCDRVLHLIRQHRTKEINS